MPKFVWKFLFITVVVLVLVPASMLFPSAPVDPANPDAPKPAVQKYHIYKFSGAWCPACRIQQAAWAVAGADGLLAKQNIKAFDLDVVKAKTLADAWNVKMLPTTIIVEVGSTGVDAKRVRRQDGRLTESQIKDFVDLTKTWPSNK